MKNLFITFLILSFPLAILAQKRVELQQSDINATNLSDEEPLRAQFVRSDTGSVIISPVKDRYLDEIDSIVRNEDEIIEQIFFEEGKQPYPAFVWYRDLFSDQRVKPVPVSIDSLPDEIIITLVKPHETPFCFPVKNVITSPYGWRWNRPHRGIDIRLKTGDPVHCSFDGVVRIARRMGNYGNLVVVRHYNGLETVYGHLSKINVKVKQKVKAGDVLGLGGSTGRSTGPHLHFEVRLQYEPFDPEWILDFKNYTMRSSKLYLNKSYFGIQKPAPNAKFLAYKADDSIYPEEKNNNRNAVYHTVKRGEDLSIVAAKYKVTGDRLKKINKLQNENLHPGQMLRIF